MTAPLARSVPLGCIATVANHILQSLTLSAWPGYSAGDGSTGSEAGDIGRAAGQWTVRVLSAPKSLLKGLFKGALKAGVKSSGDDLAKLAVNSADDAAQGFSKARSLQKIGARFRFSTRKEAREAAERESPVRKAIAENGPHGPHYHPVNDKGRHLNHDHYYFPKRFW